MKSLNKVILTGRLVADPEVRYTMKDEPVAHFRITVKGTDRGETPSFVNCIARGQLAKTIGEYLVKGRLVAVEGNLRTREYKDAKGKVKDWTEIEVKEAQMLDWKQS